MKRIIDNVIFRYLGALLLMGAVTALASPLTAFLGLVNIALIYLLPVLFCGAVWGRGPAMVAAAAGMLTYDFFFVPPTLKFIVEDLRYLISFAIFLLVGYITGTLSSRLKAQLTKSKLLAEQARLAQTYAETESLRTALFNSLSHDLRTPLSSIIGAVTGLLEGEEVYSPSVRKDLLQTIYQGAVRMDRFVGNLLDMARLESGMLPLRREWCDVQDIIGVSISETGEAIKGRPLKIVVQPGLPLVQADFVLIKQVLINLLDNALKYSLPESEITIQALLTGKQVKVDVTDQGQDIPEDQLALIFDKFYRLKSTLQVSGTGLGLAICKELIEAHGGKIWAENNGGRGVTFIFTLPVEELPARIPDLGKDEVVDGE